MNREQGSREAGMRPTVIAAGRRQRECESLMHMREAARA
jgi:hypothetical protein